MRLTLEQQKIVEENHKLIFGYAHKRHLNLDDWYGVLAYELCKCVIKHDKDRGELSTLFYLRCDSMLKSEYKKSQAPKRKDNNNTIELDDTKMYKHTESLEYTILFNEIMDSDYTGVLKLIYDGYTQKEIGEMLNISQSQVSRILSDARKEFTK